MSDDLVTWLRPLIRERLGMARDLVESEAAAAEWSEPTSGVLLTGPPTSDDTWEGTHPLGDSRLTRFMAANDPQDIIARCEAELAILDGFASRDRDAKLMLGPGVARQREWEGLRLAVRLLATGYRHRPGFRRDEWKP